MSEKVLIINNWRNDFGYCHECNGTEIPIGNLVDMVKIQKPSADISLIEDYKYNMGLNGLVIDSKYYNFQEMRNYFDDDFMKYEKITMIGSSAGGFIAILIASLVKTDIQHKLKIIAVQPVISILKYVAIQLNNDNKYSTKYNSKGPKWLNDVCKKQEYYEEDISQYLCMRSRINDKSTYIIYDMCQDTEENDPHNQMQCKNLDTNENVTIIEKDKISLGFLIESEEFLNILN